MNPFRSQGGVARTNSFCACSFAGGEAPTNKFVGATPLHVGATAAGAYVPLQGGSPSCAGVLGRLHRLKHGIWSTKGCGLVNGVACHPGMGLLNVYDETAILQFGRMFGKILRPPPAGSRDASRHR